MSFLSAMEIKPSIITISLIFLITTPCFSKGELDVSKMDSGVYDIDYRGPETHSYIPPPNRSRHNHKPFVHGESTMAYRKSKGFRAGNYGGSDKKSHG
ncbi:hypothetical protein ACSBR2_002972 [Camellia fascicularis]